MTHRNWCAKTEQSEFSFEKRKEKEKTEEKKRRRKKVPPKRASTKIALHLLYSDRHYDMLNDLCFAWEDGYFELKKCLPTI